MPLSYRLEQVEPENFLRFDDDDGASERRSDLIAAVWGADGPPTSAAQVKLKGPTAWRRGFAIIHHGHVPVDVSNVVEALHLAGFSTVELQMPRHRTKGRTSAGHDALFDELGDDAIRLFLDPSIRALNSFDVLDPDLPVILMGLSGGGWSTHVVAAVDERVDLSIPVAGSLPLFARPFSPGSTGDAEQVYAPVFGESDADHDGVPDISTGAASWIEIYALAVSRGRRQVQILNRYDPCCFGGDAHESYSTWLAEEVPRWSIVIDDTHGGHIISDYAVAEVLVPEASRLAASVWTTTWLGAGSSRYLLTSP